MRRGVLIDDGPSLCNNRQRFLGAEMTPVLESRSLDPAEVEKFSKIAAEWWNPKGKFAALHVLNPVRLAYIKKQATAPFARDPYARRPFDGLKFLDPSFGGALPTEPSP